MKTSIMVRVPLDLGAPMPQIAAARILREVIDRGINALCGHLPTTWSDLVLDETSGIIEIRPKS